MRRRAIWDLSILFCTIAAMEEEPVFDPDACPRCGKPVEGEKISGLGSGVIIEPDGTRHGAKLLDTAICRKCLVDLESFTNRKFAQAQKFYWGMRELGPPWPRRPSYRDEERSRLSVLAPLLQVRADRAQMMNNLRLKFADFLAGSGQRGELKQWLFFDEVKDAADRHPGVFFHLGDLAMTWRFFDSENRLQGYFIRPAWHAD